MEEKKTSLLANGLIWFGAAVSVAEFLTGTFLAPLGLGRGIAAIILGHLIGCSFFFLAGLIGARTEKSAMETVKLAFGQRGSLLFAGLNVLQLVGWTSVMIISGATAAASIFSLGGSWSWCLIIGTFIAVWLLIGVRNIEKINVVAMSALFILMIVLAAVIFQRSAVVCFTQSISFGAGLELAVAMPLSWLPLISDYTRTAHRPFAATLTSTIVYFGVSSGMFILGLGAAIFTGAGDIAAIMVKAGLGVAGLLIVVFSTVTVTFLDANSAGVSALTIAPKLREKPTSLIVCIVGTLLALFTPITQFENFLYLIGSVFAPMAAILIVQYFILKQDSGGKKADFLNLGLWLVGFVLYRIFLTMDTPLGSSLPVMAITGTLTYIVHKILGGKKHVQRDSQ